MNMGSESFDRIHGRGSKLKYHLGALFAVTAWGIAFINTKMLLQAGLSAVEIYVYRIIIAYLCILVICPRPFFSNSLKDELKFLLCGICGGSIYFIAENTSLNYTLVTNASLIVTTAPIITAALIGLVYRTERPNRGFMAGSLVAFIGVACVIFNSSFVVKVNPVGDLLALLAAFCWAIYSIMLRPLNAIYGAWFITRKTFFYGVLTSLPFLAIEPSLAGLDTLLKPAVIGNMVFLAVVCSCLAYLMWSIAIKKIGVMKSGNYLYISPIVTLIASYVVLHEKVSVVGYVGCALIMVGVVLSEKLGSKGVAGSNRVKH